MVEQSVQRLKGHVMEEQPDPTLHLPVSAFLPEEYVADSHQRLSLYKRLASSQQVGDLALLHGEIQDRYGPLPEPVERLLEVMQIRLLARPLGLASVEVKEETAILTFDPKAQIPEAGIRRLMDRYQRRFRLLTPLSLEFTMPHGGWAAVFPELIAALQTLTVCGTTTDRSNPELKKRA
jgi:transcription-repair coupling factor (superfamily II helicase)